MESPSVGSGRGGRFGRPSLGRRLPMLFTLLAACSVAAFGILAYRTARAIAIESTKTRLHSALAEIRTITGFGVLNQLESIRSAAGDPAVIRTAAGATRSGDMVAATAALRKLQGASPATVSAEIVNVDGRIRLALPEAPTAGINQITVPDDAVIRPMELRNGSIIIQSLAPISSGARVIGAVRVARITPRAGANRKIAQGLFGPEVVLLSGNADGTMFGDQGIVRYPAGARDTVRYVRDGEEWIGTSELIADTPWMYAMEIPVRVAVAPARALVLPFLILGAAIVMSSALAGSVMARYITRPLTDLTSAAEAIAAGERNIQLAGVTRSDEIGRLARAFDSMTVSIRGVLEKLEADADAKGAKLQDTVERLRALDAEARQNERLVKLGRQFGSVGHELRNPLGVMSDAAFVLHELPEASPKVKEYARLMREQIQLSARIISDLLDHARSSVTVESPVDVAALIDQVLAQAHVPPFIDVERNFGRGLSRVVLDKEHLTQIMWNLVSNAVEAIGEHRGNLRITATREQSKLRIEVHNSGPTIPVDQRERVFQQMYTTKPSGIGLGLFISRTSARKSGGDLYVADSSAGASFVLEIPVKADDSAGRTGPGSSTRIPA